MRHDKYYRCLCNIVRSPGIIELVETTAFNTQSDVVYFDQVADHDDLDYVDRVTAYNDAYDPTGYQHHCGTLWARRGQDLRLFWTFLRSALEETFSEQIPVIFTEDTLIDNRF